MFEYLRKVLSAEKYEQITQLQKAETHKFPGKKYQVATAALLVEIAKADGDFSEDERKRIINLMKKDFYLDDECVDEFMELSEQKVRDSISVYEFTSVINETFCRGICEFQLFVKELFVHLSLQKELFLGIQTYYSSYLVFLFSWITCVIPASSHFVGMGRESEL